MFFDVFHIKRRAFDEFHAAGSSGLFDLINPDSGRVIAELVGHVVSKQLHRFRNVECFEYLQQSPNGIGDSWAVHLSTYCLRERRRSIQEALRAKSASTVLNEDVDISPASSTATPQSAALSVDYLTEFLEDIRALRAGASIVAVLRAEQQRPEADL
jgi:hypothetical protein